MQFQNTGFHDNANCRAQPQQRGNTRDNNNREIGNRRNHGGGSNTGHANTVVAANGTSSPSVIIPARLLRLLPHLLRLLLCLLRLLLILLLRRTTPSSRLRRASATRSSQAQVLRAGLSSPRLQTARHCHTLSTATSSATSSHGLRLR